MRTSQKHQMRWWLFIVFIGLFVLGYMVTGAALIGWVDLPESSLGNLEKVFVVQTAAAVVALFYSLFGLGEARAMASLPSFVEDITGYWWQFVHDFPHNASSVVEIRYSSESRQLKIVADTFNQNGERAARWESIAAGFNQSTSEVFYFWKGDQYRDRAHAFSGIGVIQFRPSESAGVASTAAGWFTSGDLQDRLEVTGKEKADYLRVSDDDLAVVLSEDADGRAALVRSRYEKWSSAFSRADG